MVPIPNVFGDSPHWDVQTQSLYYTDAFSETFDIYRYDYNENKIYAAKVLGESIVGFIIPVKGFKNQFAIGSGDRIVKIIRWDGISNTATVLRNVFAVEQDPSFSKNHWHIAKVDPKGRFYGGTFREVLCKSSSDPSGSFYRYTRNRGLERSMGQIKVSNGIEWNVKTNKFYHVDACKFTIREYNWRPKNGKLCKFTFGYSNRVP